MNAIFRIIFCFLLIFLTGITELFAQCAGANTLEFQGVQKVYNTACGNQSYQNLIGTNVPGSGNSIRWEVSFSGGPYTQIKNGGGIPLDDRDLSKTEITNFVLAPKLDSSGDYRIRRIVTNAGASCSNTSQPVFLYYAQSSADVKGGTITGNLLGCSPASGVLTVSGNTGPVLQWESAPSSGGPWTPVSNSTNTLNYSNLTSATCYRALVDNICTGTAGSIDALDPYSTTVCITVNSVPSIATQPVSQGVCIGAGISMSVAATSATPMTYQWQKNGFDINGATAASFSIPSAANTDAGSYRVVITNSCGSTTSSAAVVTVNPAPVASVPSNSTVCPGATIPATSFSSSPAGATFTWTNSNTAIGLGASGSGNISSFAATNTTTAAISATITVTPVLNGCAGTPSSYTITVNPTAVVTVPSNILVCSGTTIPATNFSSTPAGAIYSWTNSNTAIGLPASGTGNVPSFPAASSGSATITVTPSVNGCVGTPSSYVIEVNALPVILSASKTDESACGANNGTISINATGTAPLEYSINGGATYFSNGGSFGGLGSGSYAVVVRNVSGCVVAGPILSITSPLAPAAPTIDPLNPICEGTSLVLTVTNPDGALTYNWTGPMGFTATGPSITRLNADPSMSGSYAVTASLGTCVSVSTIFPVTVNRRPIVAQPPNLTYCVGNPVPEASFISTPTGADYTWAIVGPDIGLTGNGIGPVPTFTAANTSNLPITATITITPTLNGCGGTPVSYTITVNPRPVITQNPPIAACHGLTVPQQDFTSNVAGATFSWTVTGLGASFSGNTATIPSFNAVNNGIAPLTGTVTVTATAGGCSGMSMVYNITVNPLPRVTNAPLNQITCAGVSTTEVLLESDVNGATFTWSAVASPGVAGFIDNGTTDRIPAMALSNSGTVAGTVTYTVYATANSCTGPAATYVIHVNPLPRLINPIATLSQTICSGSSSAAVNLDSDVTGTRFNWTAVATGTITGFLSTGTGQTQLPSQTLFNTGTAAGTVTYTITPVSNTNCFGPTSVYTITVNPLPTAMISGDATVCYGADATLSVALTGASPWSFTYSDGTNSFTRTISSGSSSVTDVFTVSATSTKTYTILSVSDALCSNSGSGTATITQPLAPLAAMASGTNVSCFGVGDGSIIFTGVSGGSGTYKYSIDGGGTWQTSTTFTALAPGPYNLQVRDAANVTCTFIVNAALAITQPSAALTASISGQTNVLCFGASTGSASVTASGGTVPYSYLWSNGAPTATLSGVTAGTYTVNVSDANGCTIATALSVTITQPLSALTATANSVNVSCFGGNEGSITLVSVSGGSGTYEYSINGGTSWQAGPAFTNLIAGSYNVLVRDASAPSCVLTVNASLTITQPSAALTASGSGVNVTCFGAGNGSISFSGASGGTGPYAFSINNGVTWQAAATFTGLIPGTYSLQVRDAANCTFPVNTSLTITQPSAALTASISSQTNVLCFGASTGSASVTASGGTAPYSYRWSNGATSANLSSVPAGTYTVNISDANGCTIATALSVTITQPASALAATANAINVSCFGGSDGSITLVNTTGGSGTYEYSINGGINWQAGSVFTNLTAGSYHVLVRDASAPVCVLTVNASLFISEPSAALTASAISNNVTCFGAGNGSISFTGASGGTAPYSYSINNGETWQSGTNFSGLAPGTYSLQVRDAANCSYPVNSSLTINQPSAALTASISGQTNVLCFGASTGSASVTASGGTAPYTYLWSNGATSANLTNVPAGTYTVNVSDANGCTIATALSVTITQPTALAATANAVNVKCFGGSDGSITLVSVSGGSGTYEYSINGGTSWQAGTAFVNLIAGSYHVLVRDASAPVCVLTVNEALTISQLPALTATAASLDVRCFGGKDGSITISNVSGGSGAYQYRIGGGGWQNGNTFPGLGAGSYIVQVRDAINPTCVLTINESLVINQPTVLAANVVFTNVTCRGSANGSISVTNSSGGFGNYEYSIKGGSNWQSSPSFNNLAPGTYNVQMRDLSNSACTMVISSAVEIREAAESLVSTVTSSVNVSCFGSSSGAITLFVKGGVAPYKYLWSNGATTRDLNNVPAGIYSVAITDAYNCVSNQSITISQPSQSLSLSFTKNDVTCFGSNNGRISVTAIGGTAPYTYKWSSGRNTKDLTNLSPGSYTITITDAKGCTSSSQILIAQPAQALTVNIVKTNVICFNANDGKVELKVSGGTAPYSYNWSNGQKTSSLTGVAPGTYSVTIIDANGCLIKESVSITQPSSPLRMTFTIKNTVCKYSSDGTITATISGGIAPYTLNWNGRSQTTSILTGLEAGSYDITVRDAAGCTLIATAKVGSGVCTPVAVDDIFKIYEGNSAAGTTALNDFDRENDQLTFSLSQQPKNGTVVFNSDGSFTYKPNAGFVGTETMPYKICNTSGACSSANLIIRVVTLTTVNLTPALSNVREGKKVSVTAMLEKTFPYDVFIKIGYSGTAIKDRDYVLLDQFIELMIPKGKLVTTEKITIAALTDDANEGDETIDIRILTTSDPDVRIGTGAVVTIGDVYPPEPIEVENKEVPLNPDISTNPLFSPNDDGLGNDVFNIVNIVSFPDNEVLIFNRWGNEVFRMKGYNESDRVFKGFANTGLLTNTNSPLPDGVYYFLITTRRTVNGQQVRALNKGYLILKR